VLFLLFVMDLRRIYAKLLILEQAVVLRNALSGFFLIYGRQVNVVVVTTV
jgi:hypothetical protein